MRTSGRAATEVRRVGREPDSAETELRLQCYNDLVALAKDFSEWGGEENNHRSIPLSCCYSGIDRISWVLSCHILGRTMVSVCSICPHHKLNLANILCRPLQASGCTTRTTRQCLVTRRCERCPTGCPSPCRS